MHGLKILNMASWHSQELKTLGLMQLLCELPAANYLKKNLSLTMVKIYGQAA